MWSMYESLARKGVEKCTQEKKFSYVNFLPSHSLKDSLVKRSHSQMRYLWKSSKKGSSGLVWHKRIHGWEICSKTSTKKTFNCAVIENHILKRNFISVNCVTKDVNINMFWQSIWELIKGKNLSNVRYEKRNLRT